MSLRLLLTLSLCIIAPSVAHAAFGGFPPLGPGDTLRRLLQPYDLVKLNYLGLNYCENLLDMRLNTTSYTHLGSDSNCSDAWHLQFPDDCGRLVEGVAWEDEYSPVVRLELARRLVKGAIAAHVPGTRAYYFFRHRSGGKTFLIFDDEAGSKQGRLLLSTLGDAIEDGVNVGFRARKGDRWLEIDQFRHTDDPAGAAGNGLARSPRYWNESPYVVKRHYSCDAGTVDFTGRSWLSDEDMPLEFAFESTDADRLQIVVGEPGKPVPFMGDKNAPGVIHLPDRSTTFASNVAGDKTFENPDFNYLIVRKVTAWASPGYSTALLVMWEGHPERIEALAENGYGQIRVSFARKDGRAGGKVWLYPFPWVNHKDMRYIYRNAEHFLKDGKLLHNGCPSQQLVNAIPAGLAAGAFLLSKYGDPLAVTARIHAENAVDEVFDAEQDGMKLVRVFFGVKAAAWMVKVGKEIADQRLVAKYTPLVDQEMRRMLSPEAGYDGKGWASGWDHFNCIKAAWLAYDATGKREYLDVYERALTVYTIDAKGIYRYGVPMQAPGGFETYSGSLPLGVWGHAGKMEWVNTLINLDVPNGWANPKVPVKDTWNDAGAGPWAQDDANPEYVGFCLKGAGIPQKRKYILPLGSFPIYDSAGHVKVTRQPILENPFFPGGRDQLTVVSGGRAKIAREVTTLVLEPGSELETQHLVRPVGRIEDGRRVCASGGLPLIYRFNTRGAAGAGVDLRIQGDGLQVEISPDGKRWYRRLDTWSDHLSSQSVDLSVLTGSHDELLKLLEREDRRYVEPGGSFVYKLELPDVTECCLELMLGNGYKVACSSDGRTWRDELDAGQIKGKPEPDAAWLRMLDISRYLRGSKTVYLRLSDSGDPEAYGGKSAFLRRLAAYGVFKSGEVFVRLSNTAGDWGHTFALERLDFRTW